jgi:glyoxylase-like metal-dependent hydrolase (beta-lactamase superfamily II)
MRSPSPPAATTGHTAAGSALPPPGHCIRLAPGLRLVRAPDASAMRGPGTNSYLLGDGDVTLVDPGPDDPAHLAALLAALGPAERIGRILVTHRHHDHTGAAHAARAATGAPLVAYPAAAPPALPDWARAAHPGGGEGIDHSFRPDAPLAHGQTLQAGGQTLRILHTPGHLDDHICVAFEGGVLTGDHVMGWSTSLISPPEGSVGAYMDSLHRLLPEARAPFHPGHGAAIADPAARLAHLIAHREARTGEILAALRAPATLGQIVAQVYPDLPAHLHAAAARTTLAHLIDLARRGQIAPLGDGRLHRTPAAPIAPGPAPCDTAPPP